MRRLTIVIKPTNACNFSCNYCIVPAHVQQTKMSIGTFEQLCKKLSCSNLYDRFVFIWHGGEPMLMGVSYYKKVLDIQHKYLSNACVNTFQSNCSLIDDNWISFLKNHNIKVSTSIDGDEELHNLNRLIGKKGTFALVLNNVKKLQDEELFAGAITVLSRSNITHIDRIIEFFALNKINIRLNPLLPCERVDAHSDLCINPDLYADTLINCFDKWINGGYKSGEKIMIAPLTDIIFNITHDTTPRLCNFSGSCSESFLGISPAGDLFNCGRFSDIEAFKIANIDEIECIDDIIEKKRKMIAWKTKSIDDECASCEWYNICNRGCPNVSYLFYGELIDKDPFCHAYKKVFSHVYNRLDVEINKND